MRLLPIPSIAIVLAAGAVLAAPEEKSSVRVHCLDGRTLTGQALALQGTRLSVQHEKDSDEIELADVLEASLDPPASSAGGDLPGSPAAPFVEVELVNRDVLRGLLVRGLGEAGFVVRTASLGEVEVSVENVSATRFSAGYAKADDPPPLEATEKSDRVLFTTGDRLDGTLRSVAPGEIKVRPAGGADRTLRTEGLLGFALAPIPPKPEVGLRVQLALTDGTRLTGKELASSAAGWTVKGTLDGKDRTVPLSFLAGLSVRGGRGTPLSDLEPASVTVKPYWGDDPPVLPLRPRFDRAFTLDRGAPPPLRLGGRTYLRGVSAFSGTTIAYDLSGKGFKSFVASVGVDDAGPKGAVAYEVLVDGKTAWRSGVVRALPPGGEPTTMPRLDVTGAKSLSLVVHAGPDDDVQDFADWVKAALLP
jgi:hypothetical protein